MAKIIAVLSLLLSLNSWANLKLTMFPVWHGDLIFIELPSGKNILLDTGRKKMFDKYVRNYLQINGLKVDYLILTHPHGDHIEGAAQVIMEETLEEVWDNGFEATNRGAWVDYQAALKVRQTLVYQPKRDDVRYLGETKFEFFNPNVQKDNGDWNNESLIFMMVYKDVKFLFMGDAEKEAQREILSVYKTRLEADVYKIPHHGLKNAYVKEFIDTVKPKYSLCPCLPGKPNKAQVKHLKKYGELFNVKKQGTLVLETDGKIIHIRS